MAFDEVRIQEDVQTLVGERSAASKGKAAIRVDDLKPLLVITENITAAAAAADPPTQAEFNLLVDDVEKINAALYALAAIVQGKLI